MGNKNINLEEINYDIVECPENTFTEEAKDKLAELLTIRRDGNIIILCHPRHIFDAVSEDFDTKVIEKVDWNSINIDKMKQYNDYGEYSMVSQLCDGNNNQFTYLSKKARHMMKRYKDLGTENMSYPLAVIEGVYDIQADTYEYYARGIICITQNGFAVGKGPNYISLGHKESIWEKALRIGDNY